MRHFLANLPYPEKDHKVVGKWDPLLVGSSMDVIGRNEHILGNTVHPEKRQNKET